MTASTSLVKLNIELFISDTVFVDGGNTLLNSETPP